jgi:tRNA pseudouridine55 synthase
MTHRILPRYATIEKAVGETPLVAAERLRAQLSLGTEVPLAYAGRLDPMASGKLLILIGDECKNQEKYHAFDKEYQFSILFGVHTDTADVLGLAETCAVPNTLDSTLLEQAARTLVGNITLPYPHFSSKTVKGKPLHTWTLEGRLSEIEIPVKESRVYRLSLDHVETIAPPHLFAALREKSTQFHQ